MFDFLFARRLSARVGVTQTLTLALFIAPLAFFAPVAPALGQAVPGDEITGVLESIEVTRRGETTDLRLGLQGGQMAAGAQRGVDGRILVNLSNYLPGPRIQDLAVAEGLISKIEVRPQYQGSRPTTVVAITTRRPTEFAILPGYDELRVRLQPSEAAPPPPAVAGATQPVGEPPAPEQPSPESARSATVAPPGNAAQLEELSARMDSLRQQLAASEQERSALSTKLLKADEEASKRFQRELVRQRVAELEAGGRDLEQALSEKERQLAELEARVPTAADQERVDSLARQARTATAGQAAAQTELDALRTDFAQQLASAEEAREALAGELAASEASRAALETELAAVQAVSGASSSDATELRAQLTAARATEAALRQQLETVQAEATAMRANEARLEEQLAQKSDEATKRYQREVVRQEVAVLESRLQAAETARTEAEKATSAAAMQAATATNEPILAELRARLEGVEGELTESRERLAILAGDLVRAQAAAAASRDELARQTSQLAAARAEAASASGQREQLESRLAKATEEATRRYQREQARQRVSALEAELAAKQAEVEELLAARGPATPTTEPMVTPSLVTTPAVETVLAAADPVPAKPREPIEPQPTAEDTAPAPRPVQAPAPQRVEEAAGNGGRAAAAPQPTLEVQAPAPARPGPTPDPAASQPPAPARVVPPTVVPPTVAPAEVAPARPDPMAVAPPQPAEADPEVLIETARAWARAWAGQDPQAYLSFYAAGFQPGRGQSRAAWEADRRQRLAEPSFVQVQIGAFEPRFLGPDRALLRFSQLYRSSVMQDRGWKTLELVRESGQWKIADESWSAQ